MKMMGYLSTITILMMQNLNTTKKQKWAQSKNRIGTKSPLEPTYCNNFFDKAIDEEIAHWMQTKHEKFLMFP